MTEALAAKGEWATRFALKTCVALLSENATGLTSNAKKPSLRFILRLRLSANGRPRNDSPIILISHILETSCSSSETALVMHTYSPVIRPASSLDKKNAAVIRAAKQLNGKQYLLTGHILNALARRTPKPACTSEHMNCTPELLVTALRSRQWIIHLYAG